MTHVDAYVHRPPVRANMLRVARQTDDNYAFRICAGAGAHFSVRK